MKIVFVALALWLATSSISDAQRGARRLRATAAAVDRFIGGLQTRGAFNGAVLVSRNGRTALSKGYGIADRATGTPITSDTRFAIASITKTFTATATLMLQDRGRLRLDDPITRYLPTAPATWQGVQVRHLLNHTSGIRDYLEVAAERGLLGLDPSVPRTHDEVIDVFRNEPLDFIPGTRFKYSNSGYYLLGEIIAAASGRAYETFIEQEILQPLGMTGSGFDRIGADTGGVRATGYTVDGATTVPASRFDVSLTYAAGALYSTVGDLGRWADALRAGRLVSAHARAQLLTPSVRIPLAAIGLTGGRYQAAANGAGWFLYRRAGRRLIAHDGALDGFLSDLAIYPGARVTVVVLLNIDSTDAVALADAVADIALDQ